MHAAAAIPAQPVTITVGQEVWRHDKAVEFDTVTFDAAPVIAALTGEEREDLIRSARQEHLGDLDFLYTDAIALGLIVGHAGPFTVRPAGIIEHLDAHGGAFAVAPRKASLPRGTHVITRASAERDQTWLDEGAVLIARLGGHEPRARVLTPVEHVAPFGRAPQVSDLDPRIQVTKHPERRPSEGRWGHETPAFEGVTYHRTKRAAIAAAVRDLRIAAYWDLAARVGHARLLGVGTDVVVYGLARYTLGRLESGLIGAVDGDCYVMRDEHGEVVAHPARLVEALEAARAGWFVLNAAESIIAGGGHISRARAGQILTEREDGAQVLQGREFLPASTLGLGLGA